MLTHLPESPFYRLIQHFVTRTFRGAGDGDDLHFGIPALLGLLATPSAFGAIFLLNKYSTLRIFLTGGRRFDVYRASIPDAYSFIVYSMVVTGAVVVLKWDRLFPDRQDYDNLALLPISSQQIFAANLCSLLFLAGVFAVNINAAACLIFPFAVTSRYDTFGAYAEFFVAHTSTVILASLFTCFALLSVLGLTMLLVPDRLIRRASLIARIMCAIALMATLGSGLTIPQFLSPDNPVPLASWIPPVWFLDLHQGLLDGGTSVAGTSVLALQATAGSLLLALATYALTYRRRYMQIPEQSDVHPGRGRDKPSVANRTLERLVLRSPFQRATYYFTIRTLFRSERHCLLFGIAAGVGFFLAAESLSKALMNPIRFGVDWRLLSVPLILSYFTIVSLRVLFDLPSERRSNWIFRSLIDRHKHESRAVGTKIMLSMIVPWLLLIGIPIHIAGWGIATALLHTAYVLLCSILLAEILLIGFRKIPFTCVHTASKDRVLVMALVYLAGLSIYTQTLSRIEAALLQDPKRFLFVFPAGAALVWCARKFDKNRQEDDCALIFEDRPKAQIQLLNLPRP